METLVVSALVDRFDGMFSDYGQLAGFSSHLDHGIHRRSSHDLDDLFSCYLSPFNPK
jgi:hypothetical protein